MVLVIAVVTSQQVGHDDSGARCSCICSCSYCRHSLVSAIRACTWNHYHHSLRMNFTREQLEEKSDIRINYFNSSPLCFCQQQPKTMVKKSKTTHELASQPMNSF